MVSTNHFRGRRLGKSLRAPISPRKPHAEAAAAEPPPVLAGLIWSCTSDVGLGVSTIPLHQAFPVDFGGGQWRESGLDQEGHGYLLIVFLDFDPNPMNVVLQIDTDIFPLQSAVITTWIWDGVTPLVLGPTAWEDGGGVPVGDITGYFPFP